MTKKESLILTAKSVACPDCIAEGRRADWAPSGMVLDHVRGEKLFNISDATRGGTSRSRPSGTILRGSEITVQMLEAELKKVEAVCASHNGIRIHKRGRAHLSGKCDCAI